MVEEKDAPTWEEVSRLTEAASDGLAYLEKYGDGLVEQLDRYRDEFSHRNPYYELQERLFREYSDIDVVWNNFGVIGENEETVSIADGINNKGKGEGLDFYWDYGWEGPSDLKSSLRELGSYLDGLYDLDSESGLAEEEILDVLDEKKKEAADVKGFMRRMEEILLRDN